MTSKILVDTNVVSYIMKKTPESSLYEPHLKNKLLSISFMTVAELYYGAEKNNWGQQKRLQLETILKNFVVIPYDFEIAKRYAKIVVEREKQGLPISCADAWIAACAVRHSVPIVTHNKKDFLSISDLTVISEA